MHQERSLLGCIPLLHRYFIFVRSRNASWLSSHKCGTHKQNFTFTRKRTDNEKRNEIGVSLYDSNEQLGYKCLFD